MISRAWRARLLELAAVTLSAVGLGLYTRTEWPSVLLGWVALVPWLAALDRQRSLRGALATGWLMSVGFTIAVFWWFPSAIRDYSGLPWTLTALVVVLLAPALEPQFLCCAVARHLADRRSAAPALPGRVPLHVLIGACSYIGAEWAFPKLFADTLGHALYASPRMRQAADIAGAPGLTFLLIIANEWVLAALRALGPAVGTLRLRSGQVGSAGPRPCGSLRAAKPHPLLTSPWRQRLRCAFPPAAGVVILIVALLAYGEARYQQFHSDGSHPNTVTAGLVQADIVHYDRLAAQMGTFDAVRMILDAYFRLSDEVLGRAKLDLLIWPETVYPTTFGSPKSEDGAAFDRAIGAFVARARVPLVFGTYDVDGAGEFNAAALLTPDGEQRVGLEMYRKRRLFPLIERAPVVLESPLVRRWLPWLGTWKAGTGPQVLTLALPDGRGLRVAPLICYDALDPALALGAVRQGADLIVTISNDSWFAYGPVPRLILALSAFASIETRRPQLRATNSGISAVIAPTGDVLDALGVDQRGTLLAAVTPNDTVSTPMLAWGDWFGPVAVGFGIALGVASVFRKQ